MPGPRDIKTPENELEVKRTWSGSAGSSSLQERVITAKNESNK
jgi:hypothetical protein